MSINTYVARKYDVEFQVIALTWDSFNNMFYDLANIAYDNDDLMEFTYCTDDYNNWYEIDSQPLREMLKFLKGCEERDGQLFHKEEEICPAIYREQLAELLAPVPDDMSFVRVEFD